MKCSKCGAEVGGKFCAECGAPLEEEPKSHFLNTPEVEHNENQVSLKWYRDKNRLIIVSVVCIILVVGIVLGSIFLFSTSYGNLKIDDFDIYDTGGNKIGSISDFDNGFMHFLY